MVTTTMANDGLIIVKLTLS